MAFKGFNDMQKAFIKFSATRMSVLLRAPTGTGKTLASYGLFAYLRKNYGLKRMVVVAKTKTLAAFKKSDNNVQRLVISEITEKTDLNIFHDDAVFSSEVYLISAGQLNNLIRSGSTLQKKSFMRFLSEPTLFVVDELSDYRNVRTSSVATSLDKVVKFFHSKIQENPKQFRFLGITATPIYKDLTNWFPIGNFLSPGMFGSYWDFIDRYVITQTKQAWAKKRVYTNNGSHHIKGSRSYLEIVGFKNQEHLYSKLEPFVFNWEKTDFEFIHHLVPYTLDQKEQEKYLVNLKGEGLDKQYTLKLYDPQTKKSSYIYRDKTDTLVLTSGQLFFVKDIRVGTAIQFDGKRVYVDGIYDRVCDGNAVLRFLRAQSALVVKDKFKKIGDICEKHNGTFIYSNYLYNQQELYRYLLKRLPNRRIVKVDGSTSNFDSIIQNLPHDAIILGTRVTQQSIDLYQESIIFEVSPSNPGSLNQILGRCARYNADTHTIHCYFMYKDRGIDNYLLERCRLLLKDDKNAIYAKNIPATPFVEKLGEDYNIDVLKQQLLWVV